MFAADIKKFLFDSFKRKGTKKKILYRDVLVLSTSFIKPRPTDFARNLNTFEKNLMMREGMKYSKKYDVYTYNMI